MSLEIYQEEIISKSITTRTKYDSAWKEIIEIYFASFIKFFMPQIYEHIDWNKKQLFLDQELFKIDPLSSSDDNRVDKLILLYFKGQNSPSYLHVEVQKQNKADFSKRMFTYRYRLQDAYMGDIVSTAVLLDPSKSWRPTGYRAVCHGSSIEVKFPIVKLVDFLDRIDELEKSEDPFAFVILTQLILLKTISMEQKLSHKIALTRKLYQKNYHGEDFAYVYEFMDWLLALPVKYALQYQHAIKK